MPGPPPPPPPSGCPPPPMPAFCPPSGKSVKGGGDERSALLSAIRKQPKLNRVDKSLINDRSDPLATPKPSNSGGTIGSAGGRGGVGGGSMNGPPNGLGGLFQGGMPKLKSVNRNNTNNVHQLHSLINGPDSSSSPTINNSVNSMGDIQHELRKRLNNDSRNASRGPAPPAPSRHITVNELSSLESKNGFQLNNKQTNNSHGQHRKTQSNGNFSTIDSPTTRNNNHHSPSSNATTPAKGNFGKPNLAPKPPVLEKPNNTLSNGKLRKSNSVRLPSSPLSTVPAHYNSLNQLGLAASTHHLDEKSRTLGGSTPYLSQFKPRPPINGRPTVPPPSIPVAKVKPPSHAPPPPPTASNSPALSTPSIPAAPSHAPPPPPHRTVPPVPTRAAPAVPSNAPAPPPRNSSMRPSASTTAFESRYVFHSVKEFPPPMVFRNLTKVYSTARQVGKQQAPQPPSAMAVASPPQQQQLQLAGGQRLWESSTC